MRSLLKIGLTLVILLGAVIWVVGEMRGLRRSAEYRLAREELRAEFLARAPWGGGTPGPERHRAEARALFRWHHEGLQAPDPRSPGQATAPAACLRDPATRHREARPGAP